jgi:glutathione S-transferase
MTWTLTIGNKAYSSWSLRPWLLLRQFTIPFEERVIPLYEPTSSLEIQRHSPSGKVPVLEADGVIVWESLAILEFVAEARRDLEIWPADAAARAMARSLSAEMHGGFGSLRGACPTNFRRKPAPVPISAEVKRDIERIEVAWAAARRQWGQGGPFLFGAFTAADAMFAPVVSRFHTYAIDVTRDTLAYMDAMQALPAWKAWIAAGEAESWVIPKFEIS